MEEKLEKLECRASGQFMGVARVPDQVSASMQAKAKAKALCSTINCENTFGAGDDDGKRGSPCGAAQRDIIFSGRAGPQNHDTTWHNGGPWNDPLTRTRN